MCKERQTNFHHVAMFPLCRSILLMCMRARNKVRYTKLTKKGIKVFVLTTPISLHSKNFTIKESLNKSLEFSKILEDLRFKLDKIDPCKFAIVINKTHIIFITIGRFKSRSPYIRENKFREILVDLGYVN
jgi:hypothetical protein